MRNKQDYRLKKRKTVSKQLTVIFLAVVVGTILTCLLMNAFFLERYYRYTKQKELLTSYEKIKSYITKESFDQDEFTETLNQVATRWNISMCILDMESETKYVAFNEYEHLDMRLLGYIFGKENSGERGFILEEKEDYILQVSIENGLSYLELYGRFDNGFSFILRSPVQAIHEAAMYALLFFAVTSVIGIVIGGMIIMFVTRRITKPLKSLNEISDKMVHLDFDAKYDGADNNEIGMLGLNMNRMSESLQHTISELKTANAQLHQDIEKKDKLEQMRKEFLDAVSHELKTPIALIQGYAEGLQDNISDDPETNAYYCSVIIDEAMKMNRLVKQITNLNQLENGNEKASMERFDIVELIREYMNHSKLITDENGITVMCDITGPHYVWGDQFMIEEVFNNYFSNAIHHCDGEKIIEVKLENRENRTRISVFNTGNPIPEDSLPHIWEKFYKVDKARTREYGGSGIGLSIVKAIMDVMNQAYGVDNFQNGVSFWFELEQSDVDFEG